MSRIKAKGKKTRPELSLADKVVYHSMIIVIFVITLFVLFGSMIKTDEYVSNKRTRKKKTLRKSANETEIICLINSSK